LRITVEELSRIFEKHDITISESDLYECSKVDISEELVARILSDEILEDRISAETFWALFAEIFPLPVLEEND